MPGKTGTVRRIWKAVRQLSPGRAAREAQRRLALGAGREEVARRIIREVSQENAVFVIATALGDVVPSILTPILGTAEAAGDTIFLTANQVRMTFLIGAVYGEKVGYTAQWREITSIIGAAFGWRSLARNLVSKGAIAYAGTTVVGEGLIFFYTTGRRMTRQEIREAFRKAYSSAGDKVRSLVERFRPGSASDESSSGT